MAINQAALNECINKMNYYNRLKREQQEKKEKYENLKMKIQPQLISAIERCKNSLSSAQSTISNKALVVAGQTIGIDKIEEQMTQLGDISSNLQSAVSEIEQKINECNSKMEEYRDKYNWWRNEKENVIMGR